MLYSERCLAVIFRSALITLAIVGWLGLDAIDPLFAPSPARPAAMAATH
jgi:hypothetical protein